MTLQPAAHPAKEEQSSEAQALAEIISWSKDCPPWQRDALRRLCLNGELTADDINDLTGICRSNAATAVPLTLDHIRDPRASVTAVTLRAMHELHNVNALAEGECLTFDKSGVTVVYGDNGSGKSGYVRVLKMVCRARSPKDERVLPNIYAANAGPQQATVEFVANGQNKADTWTAGKAADALLSSVSVFDSRSANVHVDQTNDVAYTPFPLKILGDLAQACQQVKTSINAEIGTIESQSPVSIRKPGCKPNTAVGKLVARLSSATKPADVEKLAALTKDETARLETLKGDLARDPAKVGRHLLGLAARLDSVTAALEKLELAIADVRATAFANLRRAYKAAAEAADAAATTLFANEPLPHIGSDAWHTLWSAARTFSQQEAYPGQSYPVISDAARCVLCQQKLGAEAAKRLERFEEFVCAEVQKKERAALEEYEAEKAAIAVTDLDLAVLMDIVATIRDELNDDTLAASVRAYAIATKWRLRHLLRHHAALDAHPLPTIKFALPKSSLSEHASELKTRATALIDEETSDARKKLIAEADELADRQWLSVVKDDLIAEIERRKQIAALQQALKSTITNSITAKSAELAEHLVTNTLRAQFTKEVDRLGVAGLAIELRKEKTSYGVPLFRVSLIKKPEAAAGAVLSEGEHRCVALAAFLAELSTTDSKSAIVFDDPVSSLDHMHREAVAARLAEEGSHRQIVVFTHDIAFLFLLNEACHEMGTHIGFRSVSRGTEFAGYCSTNPPPNAQPGDKVVEGIQKQLDNQAIHFQQGNQQAWYLTVRSLQEQLRTTWERAVEDAVAPVIKRLANKVDTKGLSKLTAITVDDCKVMREAYGRCSNLLHSSSEALNKPLPPPEKVQTEINALRDWITDLKGRQAKVSLI